MTSLLQLAEFDSLLQEPEFRRLRQMVRDIPPDAAAAPVEARTAGPGDDDSTDGEVSWRKFPELNFPLEFGSYRILRPLASGGMGQVFVAQQSGSDRQVALKMIRPDLTAAAMRSRSERFLIEARATANLHHDHIVTVYEVGQVDGQHFYSMQLVDGQSLSAKIRQGPLASRRAARWLKAIAEAVQCAHEAGILHRDIKPGNIMIDGDGRPLLMDFGVARYNDHATAQKRTQPGTLLGTVAWMSPEQSIDAVATDQRSDIYSLGAVLYFCLTGRPPFLADHPAETIRQLQETDAVPPRQLNPAVPRDLNTICLKCLEKDPACRYAAAADLVEDLDRFLTQRPIRAKPPSPWDRLGKWVRRNRSQAALLGVLACLPLVFWWVTAASERRSRSVRLADLVESIENADTAGLPLLLTKLDEHATDQSISQLQQALPDANPRARRQLGIALLYLQPTREAFLPDDLGILEPEQVRLVRDILQSPGAGLPESLVARFASASSGNPDFVPLACLIAGDQPDPEIWSPAGPQLARKLLYGSRTRLNVWLDMLRSVRGYIVPEISRQMETEDATDIRLVALAMLCEFHKDDPAYLTDRLGDAQRGELSLIVDYLRRCPADTAELQKIWSDLPGSMATDDRTPGKVANIAVARVILEDSEAAWNWLWACHDRDLQTEVIHRLVPAGVDPESLVRRVAHTHHKDALYPLLMVLGQLEWNQLDHACRQKARAAVQDLLVTHPDPPVHSAAEWVLRRWRQEPVTVSLETSAAIDRESAGRKRWYVTATGQTMACFPVLDGEFLMGSPDTEPFRGRDESLLAVRLSPFAIATCETTLAQFARFRTHPDHDREVGPSDDRPVNHVRFCEAAAFCNWLSRQEGLEPDQCCYEMVDGQTAVTREDFLKRPGYRLPTEAEWEFACRAGSSTSRFVGDSDQWLTSYAWFVANADDRMHAVGSRMPNQFGLFDVYGNAMEWCHKTRAGGEPRFQVLKGAAFPYGASHLRSAKRYLAFPTSHNKTHGFRVARTLTPAVSSGDKRK
jgi:serine/threonine protein kinase/formylglycine-generating enzyme required for sulfatase activity